ncbi:type II secretion system F family protein [Patescibacteria group bacterium]|nr:type II secretion system F family protein [Patescibacteria group bacterium]
MNDKIDNNLLNKIQKKIVKKKETAIYGLYDNHNASWATRINDFLIDHSGISLKEKSYFFHLMAVMIDAGIPMLRTLEVLSGNTDNLKFQRVINTLVYSTSGGQSLSDSMARFPEVFTETEVGVIKAGEVAGNLNKMLFQLSLQLEKSHDLQTKLITAATYPVVILITLIAIVIAMMVWVVPTLIRLLSEGGLSEDQYPLPTKILLAISNFITGYWWAAIFGFIIFYAIYKVYKSTPTGKFQIDYLKLRIPIVGTLMRKVLVLRFVNLLGILLDAGLPVLKALQIIGGSIDNELYKLKTWEIIKDVQVGGKISESLEAAPFLFSETVVQMLSIGESSASIGSISQKISIYFDREISHTLKRLTALFEPIMILFVGVIVGLLALAILMPIFNLTSLV